jgi:hypothetical protein
MKKTRNRSIWRTVGNAFEMNQYDCLHGYKQAAMVDCGASATELDAFFGLSATTTN